MELTILCLLTCLLIDRFSLNKHLFTPFRELDCLSLYSFIYLQLFIEISCCAVTRLGSGGAKAHLARCLKASVASGARKGFPEKMLSEWDPEG